MFSEVASYPHTSYLILSRVDKEPTIEKYNSFFNKITLRQGNHNRKLLVDP